jgi:peptidoglycan/xylan/chitin deacetylase (PgdA/CDA1 family)
LNAIPVLTYHSIGPGERLGPERFGEHLAALARCGLPSLLPADLDTARRGFLLTFDDGFADLWTHGLQLLQEHHIRAVVFAIPSRTGDGPPRPQGHRAFAGSAKQVHEEAAAVGGVHPGHLRWSELAALEASGLVAVQSHSQQHAMGWIGDEIVGFHLGESHWSLPQATGGDQRLGIPLYRRGSVLAHRCFADDKRLRDHLAGWIAGRGGKEYATELGRAVIVQELRREAQRYRNDNGNGGCWETEDRRRARTIEDLAQAREALERRLGGRRDELCLPWGEYDRVTLDCARQAGIRRVYTLDRGPNPAGEVGFLVNRFEPRARGGAWVRLRLWIYRSTVRTRAYGVLSGRSRRRGS